MQSLCCSDDISQTNCLWTSSLCYAGVNQWEAEGPPRYANHTHLSARVAALNPRWNEDSSSQVVITVCCPAAPAIARFYSQYGVQYR